MMVVRRVYDQILAAYKEQPRVSGIYFCTPQSERRSLNFFPGHRGFSGDDIVIGGVIIVGHNFSNLSTWKEHINIDEQETDRTWGNLRKYYLDNELDPRLRFKNAIHGVRDITSMT